MMKPNWFYKKSDNKEHWPDGVRPITFNDDGAPSWLSWVFFPFSILFLTCHFSMCVFAMLRFRTEKRRREFYEYYAPWGWGELK